MGMRTARLVRPCDSVTCWAVGWGRGDGRGRYDGGALDGGSPKISHVDFDIIMAMSPVAILDIFRFLDSPLSPVEFKKYLMSFFSCL